MEDVCLRQWQSLNLFSEDVPLYLFEKVLPCIFQAAKTNEVISIVCDRLELFIRILFIRILCREDTSVGLRYEMYGADLLKLFAGVSLIRRILIISCWLARFSSTSESKLIICMKLNNSERNNNIIINRSKLIKIGI